MKAIGMRNIQWKITNKKVFSDHSIFVVVNLATNKAKLIFDWCKYMLNDKVGDVIITSQHLDLSKDGSVLHLKDMVV